MSSIPLLNGSPFLNRLSVQTLAGTSNGLVIDAGSDGLRDFVREFITNDTAQTGNLYAHRTIFTLAQVSGFNHANGALLGQVTIEDTNANDYTARLSGLYGYIHHEGSGTVQDGRGSYNIAGIYGAGDMVNGYGTYSFVFTDAGSSGRLTNGYTYYAAPCQHLGAGVQPANVYGFYCAEQTAGIANYAFYSAGTTPSSFGGAVAVGGALTVTGNITASRNGGLDTAVTIDADAGRSRSLIFTADAVRRWAITATTTDALRFTAYDALDVAIDNPITIANAAGGAISLVRPLSTTSYIEGTEVAAPAAPAADGWRLYGVDNGAGKTQVQIRFSSGAAQVIATQP